MVALRDYQKEVVAKTYSFFRLGIKSVLIFAPTGAGKTVLASQMIADAVSKGRKALFLVHRTKLISQTANTLQKAYGIESGVIWAYAPTNYDAPVQIAMVQSIQNRQLPNDIGLVIVDEAHTTSYYSIIQKIFAHYSGGILALSKCYFIGLSATPWRTKKKEGFCQFYQAIASAPAPQELIKRGHLTRPRFFGWNGLIDFNQLETKNGDYTIASMQKVCDGEFNKIVVDKFLEFCPERKAIAFCASVAQCHDLARQFNEAGIIAESVTGETPEDLREEIYKRFKEGKTRLITSVMALCEGFDETSCDAALIARPTKSRALFVQMCGRALRLHEGKKDALLLDFCENFDRLGLPTKPHKTPLCPKDKDEPFTPTKECPACHAQVLQFAKICPECGHEFEGEQEEEDIKTEDGIFGEILDGEEKKRCAYLRSQLLKAYNANKNTARVSFLYYRKYNEVPPAHWYKDAIFRRGPSVSPKQQEADKQVFIKYLKKVFPKAGAMWIKDQMRREFGNGRHPVELMNWWDVLGIAPTTDWNAVKEAYAQRIVDASKDESAILNFALDEAKEFCSVVNLKAV